MKTLIERWIFLAFYNNKGPLANSDIRLPSKLGTHPDYSMERVIRVRQRFYCTCELWRAGSTQMG